jgi:tyrosine-protein phosphatase SIW14
MRRRSYIVSALVAAHALAWVPATAQVTKPAQPPGLPRFGMVTSHLFRGGQPESRGFAELKGLGVDLVVNLRNEPNEIARERALVEAQGLRYASIPWRGKENPKPDQVAEFLNLLRTNAGKKVFVHCERGSERTGVMVACYRMSTERWTAEQALREMDTFGFRRFGFAHLKRFVREFPTLLTREPFLSKPDLEK